MDAEQVLLEQDDKKWERAWTTDEIRKNSANWTLAGDAGLYSLLCEFSQNIISRTHEVQNAVDTLVHNTKMASVRVNNVINDFHMLSNVQFVENRVYDEEVQETTPEAKPVEKTKEQREAEMLPKIIKAVELGMSVLDQAFNKINVNEISDSEDEELSSEGRTIFEPKDPYEHRPLPFIIGSEEFMADDYAGLKDLIQEDAESSVEIESSSSESSDETSSEEEDLPLDDKFSEVPSPQKDVQSVSDRYSSSEESELFGVEKAENGFISDSSLDMKTKEIKPVPKAANDSKVNVRDTRQGSVSSIQSRLNLPQVLPMPKHTQNKKESEDLFADADDGSDDESPFRKKTGLFASEIRFDDEKDMFENDLFSSLPKETSKPAESNKVPTTQKLPTPQKNKEPDLFGDDDDSEDDIFNKLSKAKKPSFTKDSFVTKQESPEKADSSSTPSSAPSIKSTGNTFGFMSGGGGASDSLFGDESDGDDLFSSKKTTSKKFDFAADDDDEDDLFGLGKEKSSKKPEVTEKKPNESDKTSPLFESSNTSQKSYKKIGMPLPGLTTKKPKDLIFDDSDSSEQGDSLSKPTIVAPISKENKNLSLFDEDDDEDDIFSQKPKLFSPGKSPSLKSKHEDSLSSKEIKDDIKPETPKVENKLDKGPSLFEDLDLEKPQNNLMGTKKIPDTSLFEESDSFDLFKPKAVEKKVIEVVKPISVSEKSKTNSLFNDIDVLDGATSSKFQKSSSQPPESSNDQIVFDFDTPADSSKTLNVLSKDRARISTKRRKPTRKGRLAALESSEKQSDSQSPAPVKSIAENSADDIFSSREAEIPPEPKLTPTHKVQEKKKMDLMSQLMSEAASSKVGKKSAIKKEEKEEEVVDIFSELDGTRESKSQSFSFLSPIESSPKPNLLDEEKADGKDAGSSGFDFDEADNDEFFAEPAFRNFSNSISKKESILDLDDDDDDLFNIKPNPVLKSKPDEAENDIFADDSDIFSDIQKEKYEMFPSQLYDNDDDDDIFGNIEQSSNKVDKPQTKVTNSVPMKKEAEKKVVKEVEKKPAFDDPLRGLLGED